jgi:hypothetical protein
MKRLGGVLAALTVAVPASSQAAELTRIVSSFEEGHPFGFSLEVGYQRTQVRSKIVHEAHQGGQLVDAAELIYVGVDQRLVVDARIGLWRDLEFKYAVPFVLAQDRSWRYASGTSDANSTIVNNCIRANGELLDVNCPTTGAGSQPIFNPNSNSYRGGLGDMTFGLAYALFNQEKDDTKPMWIVGLDYTAPTAAALDPTVRTTSSSRGKLGDRVHRYKFYTSLSRRMGIFDPYFQMQYTLPVRGPGWYSNCDHPDPGNMGRPQNCGDPSWSRADTGIQPPHTFGTIFGSEFNVYVDRSQRTKLAVDLRGTATYFSPGRYYNELSDLFGKLLYTEEYLQYGGELGFIAYAGPSFTFQARGTLDYNTPHRLTSERIGKDLDNDGTVDVTANPREINPTFDFRSDMVSRRFRATEMFVFRIDVSARFNF